jgi:flagellar protein FlgJ
MIADVQISSPATKVSSTADARADKMKNLKKACADLESVFVSEIMKAMRNSVPKSGLFPEAAGSDVYQSIADTQFAEYLSQGSGFGLGEMVYNQMAEREDVEGAVKTFAQLEGLNYKMIVAPALMKGLGAPAAENGEPETK